MFDQISLIQNWGEHRQRWTWIWGESLLSWDYQGWRCSRGKATSAPPWWWYVRHLTTSAWVVHTMLVTRPEGRYNALHMPPGAQAKIRKMLIDDRCQGGPNAKRPNVQSIGFNQKAQWSTSNPHIIIRIKEQSTWYSHYSKRCRGLLVCHICHMW